jgi:hypothetical protein
MRTHVLSRALLCLLLLGLPHFAKAQAQAAVDAFGKCLADNTSGKDRKDLARWLFVAMGAHADMKAISTIAASAAEDTPKIAAALFTRLVADSCPEEARAALNTAGPVAFQSAFTVLGQLAMRELMADKDVAASMALLQKHIDSKKVQAALEVK